jgi:hypothetical protein
MNEKAQTLIPYITTKCSISSYFAKNKCSNWARTRVVEGKESLWRKVIELADVLYACGFEVRKINRSLFSQFKDKATMRHETLELVYHTTNNNDVYAQVRQYKGKGKWRTWKFSRLQQLLQNYSLNPSDVEDFMWLLSLETAIFRTYNMLGRILEELNLVVTEKEGEMRK